MRHFRFDCHTNILDLAVGSSFPADLRCTIKLANKTASADFGNSVTVSSAPATAGGAMMLLGYYNDPATRIPVNCAAARVYGCKVVRSGTLIHDWVPVRTQEGLVTLYDRVTDELLPVTGTGKLTAGPVWAHEGPVEVPKGTFILFR